MTDGKRDSFTTTTRLPRPHARVLPLIASKSDDAPEVDSELKDNELTKAPDNKAGSAQYSGECHTRAPRTSPFMSDFAFA